MMRGILMCSRQCVGGCFTSGAILASFMIMSSTRSRELLGVASTLTGTPRTPCGWRSWGVSRGGPSEAQHRQAAAHGRDS